MNDRHAANASRWRELAAMAAAVSFTLPAQALDWAAPFSDPLSTLPPLIEVGTPLPGDSEPVLCPTQKDFSRALTLAEAVDLALCNNPQIKTAWATIKVQAGALGEARAAYLPTLSATTNRLQTRTTYSNAPTTKTSGETISATLAWRLFDFGGREANRETASNLLAAAMANHDAALQKTLATVVQAYFDTQTAKALLAAKEENESIADSTLNSALRRETHGAASRGDRLQASTALAKASLDKNRALGAYRKAQSVLVYALGIPTQTQLILADDLQEKAPADARNLEVWLNLAEKTHPAILAARAQWEAAKQKTVSVRSDGLPILDFTGNYYENGYPGQGVSTTQSQVSSVGLSLTIPLFDGFSRTYKIRGAEALAEQREAELRDAEQNVLAEVVKTYADAEASLNNLEASERLLGTAQESLDTSRRRYEKGAADILEILNTQTALSDARQERIRSLADWRSARLRLLSSAGLMGRDALAP
jgi:outer membrane protein